VVNSAVRATLTTRIIVAHRPETIRAADRVVLLEQDAHASDHFEDDRDDVPQPSERLPKRDRTERREVVIRGVPGRHPV
jgi:ABC-type protease/lipase transport system fused ATPase/permease subunit